MASYLARGSALGESVFGNVSATLGGVSTGRSPTEAGDLLQITLQRCNPEEENRYFVNITLHDGGGVMGDSYTNRTYSLGSVCASCAIIILHIFVFYAHFFLVLLNCVMLLLP